MGDWLQLKVVDASGWSLEGEDEMMDVMIESYLIQCYC